MRLKSIELSGFKSFAKKTTLEFSTAITSVVGPNGSGKSNVAESFRFVLGEQSMKSMRGRRGEDLIWNGSAAVPRSNRAGVRLVFDNRDRSLNLDFDEVSIERVVHRGGTNEYLINGSNARLRDIAELLSQANIGGSGHHIISQGEADRILSAGSRERREMLEDALGLTQYLYKREEAHKKLEKTAENVKEIEGLRRELAPHLKFLGTQVKKIEQAQALARELLANYLDYFKRESVYLASERAALHEAEEGPKHEHAQLGHRIDELRIQLSKKESDSGARELMELERKSRDVVSAQERALRELGAIEGELRAHERRGLSDELIPASDARTFAQRVIQELEVNGNIAALVVLAKEFLRRITERGGPSVDIGELQSKKVSLEKELAELKAEQERVASELSSLRERLEGEKDASRDAERELFAAMARRGELEASLASMRARHEILAREESTFKQDLGEAAALVGREVTDYEAHPIDLDDEPRSAQEDRRRKLERQKIRLEESGSAGAGDVLKEYEQTSERDQFLARELADLATSTESLNHLITELTVTLETRFVQGVDKINTEFDQFFKLMFGGGTAALTVVQEKKVKRGAAEGDEDRYDDDEDVQEGVEIAISLPHKRVKGLHMLSGGERALTSIALIFAMSQVNPPPFLILDETDAALDEANSRRYGDMIETLAKHSQLIVITHNRETMSRAGVLYGITMGSDGVSKLLTVKFEEALAVAK